MEDRKRIDNPLTRFRLFLEGRGWWDAQAEEELKTRLRADVLKAFKHAEAQSRCELSEIFTDIYGGEEPWNIVGSFNMTKVLAADPPHVLERATRGLGPTGGKVRPRLAALESRITEV